MEQGKKIKQSIQMTSKNPKKVEAGKRLSFPIVSKKGITYLFRWFCPTHGHCYGYHIIPGSEGHNDAANTLYNYLHKAPENVFYDFACSLDEYTKNRENESFENTRFFS